MTTLEKWEEIERRIEMREKEVHTLTVKHKNGTTSKRTEMGYISEDAMQADFFQWTVSKYPQLRNYIFHIENEGNNSSKFAAMKGAQALTKGKLAGVFDNLCVYNDYVWIELKLYGKDFSEPQKLLYNLWTKKGYKIYKVDNFREWRNVIEIVILKINPF